MGLITTGVAGSPLVRGRGLKRQIWFRRFHPTVAPRAGAWIETADSVFRFPAGVVAPRAGAWIETKTKETFVGNIPSPLVRGRGLKLWKNGLIRIDRGRPSCGGVD